MKKSTVLAGIFFLSLILLNACSKKEQLSPVNDPPEQNIPTPLSAPLFDELNETIARFDLLYLQIVYKDKRTKADINEEAARLIIAINQNPTSLVIQKELMALYHFNNFADLQKASNIISTNSGELKKTFLGKDTVLSKAKMNQLNEARKTFIKNKIISLEKASQRSSTGLWQDNADWILNEFHYYSQIANLEMGLDGMDDLGGAGAGPGCTESCCFEYQGCLVNAASNYRLNFIILGSTLAASVGSLGALYGSIIPFIGTIAVGTGAGIIGGVTGYIQAVHIYMNDQNVCALNYKACILKKMEINNYYMNKIQKPSHHILSKKELYFTACALFIMTVTHNYTKDKFKDGYQFLLSFLSILPTIFIFLKIQSLILLDIKRNPTQLNNSLKYVIYAMILIFGSAPFLYLWSMRDVISQLKW